MNLVSRRLQVTIKTIILVKGGLEDDRIIYDAQPLSKQNKASFMSPPDGQHGEMRLGIFSKGTPSRDSSLENMIPIHEYMHGISIRMTGGPANHECFGFLEPSGMGEGWSDAIAIFLQRISTDTRETVVRMGIYTSNNPDGIRIAPYSTDTKVNNLMFSDLEKFRKSHLVGAIWATVLYELYWNLVEKYGFSSNFYDAKQSEGNIVALQLMIGALAIQPCNPTFLQGRDAIIAFDEARYDGMNFCEIWRAFAKRGMGVKASTDGGSVINSVQEDFTIPPFCQITE